MTAGLPDPPDRPPSRPLRALVRPVLWALAGFAAALLGGTVLGLGGGEAALVALVVAVLVLLVELALDATRRNARRGPGR
ncbi:hypothetical protein [Kineococcus sp. SYSU DK004]|uniref:hypothetical protein n=1 Tax=Kineococcus sp. SYSU DK004 TaxID=3383125 RepID=UPI003D7E9A70